MRYRTFRYIVVHDYRKAVQLILIGDKLGVRAASVNSHNRRRTDLYDQLCAVLFRAAFCGFQNVPESLRTFCAVIKRKMSKVSGNVHGVETGETRVCAYDVLEARLGKLFGNISDVLYRFVAERREPHFSAVFGLVVVPAVSAL